MIKNPPFSLPKGLKPDQIRSEAETRHQEKGGSQPPATESYEIKALLHELEVHQIELEIQKEELEFAYEQQTKILEEYSDLYDFSPVGYLSLNEEGTIMNLNLRAAGILDHTRSELGSHSFFAFIASTDRSRFHEFFTTLPTAPEKNSIEVQLEGQPHFVELEGFVTSDTGEIRLVMIDRTQAKTSEAENFRLMTAIEGANDTIVITDQDARILYVNHAFEVATGYSKAEALGQNPRILQSGNQDPEFYQKMWSRLSAGKPWRGTFHNKMKDGTLVEEEATISPILDDRGEVTHYVAVKRNIMEIRSLEAQLQQAQKMEAVGRLAGGVAHDFNNLLMGMMGYCDLCENQLGNNPPALQNLNDIRGIIDRAAETSNQLLVFARKKAFHPVNLDLNERITLSTKFLRRLLGESFPLSWAPENTPPCLACIDPVQVDQILANLCINAKDSYTAPGEIVIQTGKTFLGEDDANMLMDIEPGPYVWVSVRDTGSGMSDETKSHIFEPFYTTKGVGKGTGLGLAIIYAIVKQNNGFVRVKSEEGKGSTFTISLPEVLGKKTDQPQSRPDTVPLGNGEALLVVDDEVSIRTTLQFLLQTLGYRVTIAASPSEALELQAQHLETDKFDLLLSDISMPEMSGIHMASHMKERQPDLEVLYMTGHILDGELQEMEVNHPELIIHKPFTRLDIAIKLHELLAR